jgi:hypothetical protein
MNWDQIDSEQEAYQSVTALLELARKCEQLHQRAGLALPDRIQRLLGVSGSNGNGKSTSVARTVAQIPGPDQNRPKSVASECISINTREAIVTTLVLAILKEANGEPVRPRDITDRVMKLRPDSTSGSVANSGTRLVADGVVERTDDGWKLLKPERAATIQDGLLWGSPDIFIPAEIAAYRRAAILHILKHYPKGQQIIQIVEALNDSSWFHATANKDMLKADMQDLLKNRKVRRVGNTRKWQLAPSERAE